MIVLLNPFSVVLNPPTGQPLALGAASKREQTETIRTLAVVLRSACGRDQVRGWLYAHRLSAEQAGESGPAKMPPAP